MKTLGKDNRELLIEILERIEKLEKELKIILDEKRKEVK